MPASVGQIGRHISQTKAINTGTYLWFPHELEVMRAVGNGVAARAFGAEAAAAKPSRDAAPEAKLAYARRKYEDCVFGVPTYDKAVGAAAPIAPATGPQLVGSRLTNLECPKGSEDACVSYATKHWGPGLGPLFDYT